MAHIVADRVYDTTTTTGTGAVTVSGSAPSGYRTFSAVLTTNDTCYYAIAHQTAAEWEVGLGTYSASNQLTRTTILSSSNANNAVNFSAGTKDIYITDPAARDNQNLYGATTDTAIAKFNGTNGQLQDSAVLIDSSNNIKNAITLGLGSSSDVILGRNAAANLRLGAADAAAPVAQTLSVQSVVTGTSNTAGANFTIAGSKGTGTGAGGSILFQTAAAGSTGTSQNALATAMTIDGSGIVAIGTTPVTGANVLVGKNITGAATNAWAFRIVSTVQPDVTGNAQVNNTFIGTASNGGTPYTINTIRHYFANQTTFNADSTVNTQYGFMSGAALVSAITNHAFYADNTAAVGTGKTTYGFYSNVNTATGGGTTYGFYAAGTADNVMPNLSGGIAASSTLTLQSTTGAGTTDAIIFKTASQSEKMRIDTSGNVGIGAASAGGLLEIRKDQNAGTVFAIRNQDTGASAVSLIQLTTGTTGALVNISVNGSGSYAGFAGSSGKITTIYQDFDTFVWRNVAGSTRMTIDSNGKVGIGKTPSLFVFEVNGSLFSNQTTNVYCGFGDASAAANPATYFGIDYDTTNNRGRIDCLSGGVAWRDIALNSRAGNTLLVLGGGLVGIGTGSPTALLTLAAGTATANTAPLKFTSGTNLTTPEAGVIEYDGTIMTATTNTNFKRGTIPVTNYSTGAGTALGTNTEATLAVLLPAANDTITLSIGTYFLDITYIVTRGASTTGATSLLNIRGTGNAVGTFSGIAIGSATNAGAGINYSFNAVTITTDNTVAPSSNTSGGIYVIHVRGILKITTAGTIIPQYRLGANINGAGTVSNVFAFKIQQLDTQSAAAFGPAGTGWG